MAVGIVQELRHAVVIFAGSRIMQYCDIQGHVSTFRELVPDEPQLQHLPHGGHLGGQIPGVATVTDVLSRMPRVAGGVCPHPLPQPRPDLQPRLAGGGPRGALPAAGRPPQHPAPPGHRRQPRHRPRHGGGHLRQLPHLLHVLSGVAIYCCSVTFIREVEMI